MIDQQSLTWQEVKGVCEADLAILRVRIDAHGTDLLETEFARGQLMAFRKILALALTPKPPSGSKSGKGIYD